jgi:glycosyltransferase involved in cell wall biosynthesis
MVDVDRSRFVFATNSIFGRYGLGGPALEAARGLFPRWPEGLVLARERDDGGAIAGPVLCPGPPLWRRLLHGTRFHRLQARSQEAERIAFDRFAAREMVPADVFVGENSTSLLSLRRAGELGARRVVLQHNHPFEELRDILDEERDAWGGPPHFLTEALIARSVEERREADSLVAFSDSVASALVRRGVDPARMRTLRFGVDAARFAPSPPPPGPFTVAYVGWLDLRKGYPYLVQAFRDAAIPGSRLLLHGGSDIRFHHDLVASLAGGVDVRVVRGPVEETFRAAHVAVLPSVSDGFGLAGLEAMASGLPLVVTSACGVAECVEDGATGFVVPPRDSGAIRERLLALRDPALRERLGAGAREFAVGRTWDSFRTALVDHVESLLSPVAAGV